MKYEKWLMALIMLGAVALFLMAGSAFAGQAVVTWTNPTTRTDGSTFPSSQIGSTEVEYGLCSGGTLVTTTGAQAVTGAATTLTILSLPAGTWCFRARTVDTGNVHSGWSAVVSKVVPVAPPNPPVIVTVSTIAYEMQVRRGQLRLVRSRVPLGVECEPTKIAGLGMVGDKIAFCEVQG